MVGFRRVYRPKIRFSSSENEVRIGSPRFSLVPFLTEYKVVEKEDLNQWLWPSFTHAHCISGACQRCIAHSRLSTLLSKLQWKQLNPRERIVALLIAETQNYLTKDTQGCDTSKLRPKYFANNYQSSE